MNWAARAEDADGVTTFVEAYEAARVRDGSARVTDFLPAPDHPLYLAVLCELVRVEMEAAWDCGAPRPIETYRDRFPELFEDPASRRALAFEEYRLRCQAGESPRPDYYARRYAVSVADWPRPRPADTEVRDAFSPADADLGLSLTAPRPGPAGFPAVGETFLGFRLVGELGRGALGRVYLAEQGELAGRRVALKLCAHATFAEPETLARLQHTNIVPIHSVHLAGPFEAVCMPYLGPTTLAHLLEHLRGRASWPGSGRELAGTLAGLNASTATGVEPAPAAENRARAPAAAPPALRELARLNFVEAVLTLGSGLADGLAHAHERGIVHRDLKPANVLVADDGTPMLLDFNLANDETRPGHAARLGGTPAYMAPEQIEAARSGSGVVDGRADVYALGLILFELLTGRHPFPVPDGPLPEALSRLLAARRAGPPRVCPHNRAVSPAVEAIVRRCLEPDPARRYQSARALREDLGRQLAHQPLRHTAEPSVRERLAKWRRRHPRLTSASAVAAAAAALVAVLAVVVVIRDRQLDQLEAARAEQAARADARAGWEALRAEARPIQYLLLFPGTEQAKLRAGVERCRAALGRYGLPDDPDWADRPAVQRLDDRDRAALREQVGNLLLLLARAEAVLGGDGPPAGGPLELNERARARLGDGVRAVIEQRAELLARAGDAAGAARAAEEARAASLASARDHYLAAAGHYAAGRFPAAVPLLREAVRRDPGHFWSWFLLGVCHDQFGRDAEAEGCYGACTALWPDFAWSFFNRGLTFSRRGIHAEAAADFDAAARLDPALADAHVNRAMAALGLGRPAEAVRDLTRALELGAPPTRTLLLRARAKERLGDAAGANADRAEGLGLEPGDEPGWVARGSARMAAEPEGALADFDQALRLNPRSFPALQNRAHVLDANLNRPAEALRALDRAVELYPDSVPARGGRAVLLARRGDRDAALRDAAACLRLSPAPPTLYQVACVYALCSRGHPADRAEAVRLLAEALRRGYGHDLIATDDDLDPIRDTDEFRNLTQATRALAPPSDPARRPAGRQEGQR